jgi:F-type H+-transporting ATPase subunit epsilon
MHIKFQIITPERVVFTDEIDQVSVTTKDGEITILPNHLPIISVLETGELKCKKGNKEYSMAVSGGFVEVKSDNSVIILADVAEKAEEINIEEAEQARQKALKTMKEQRTMDSVEYAALQATLGKALTRLKVGNKYKKIRGEIK